MRREAILLLGALAVAPGLLAGDPPRAAEEAQSMWADLSEDELVATSALIATGEVIGTLRVSLSPNQRPVALAVLRIDEVLKGEPGTAVALLALPSRREGHWVSTDLFYGSGDAGLWFLRAGPRGTSGLLLADHPDRFVPQDQAAEAIASVRAALARPPASQEGPGAP